MPERTDAATERDMGLERPPIRGHTAVDQTRDQPRRQILERIRDTRRGAPEDPRPRPVADAIELESERRHANRVGHLQRALAGRPGERADEGEGQVQVCGVRRSSRDGNPGTNQPG